MTKKLAFLVLALALLAGAQVLTPTTAEAALTCFQVCPPSNGSDCVCCERCCTLPGGGLTCSDMPCYC